MEEMHLNVLVCGGGNGAHTLAGLASVLPSITVKVLSLFADEADRWTKALGTDDLLISVNNNDGNKAEVRSKPALITNDPSKAMEGVDIIVFTVPAFAHQQYFDAISEHIQPNTVVVGLPGQAGFEFQALHSLKDKVKQCAILSLESLPWACRILQFGREAQVLGFKSELGTSYIEGKGNYKQLPIDMVQYVLGEKPIVKKTQNYLAVNLMAKSIIHPPLMYSKWKDWDGKPLREKPLFYQGVDDLQAHMLSGVSDEVVAIAQEIGRQRPELDMSAVIHIFDWYKIYYHEQVSDSSCLKMAMRTNKAYDGLLHPMKQQDGGFVPDFNYRYTAEDVPFGLVVMKGIGEIVGVKTPVIDIIIAWAQAKLGKVFIEGSSLTGKDVKFSRAPQAYGFLTLSELCDV